MHIELSYLNEKKPLKKVIIFFITTLLWSWIFWIPSVLPYFGVSVPNWLVFTQYFALFGPSIIGIFMTALLSKNDGKQLLKSCFDFKFKKIWLLPIFFVPMGFAALATVLIIFVEGANPFAYGTSWAMLVPVLFIILFVGGPIAEEFGWRGYALDRLQLKFNATISSLILGVVHAIWHIPLFFISTTVQFKSGMPMYEFFLMVIIQTFMYTWVINNTRSPEGRPNMFLAIMIHLFGNYSSAVFPFFITTLGRWLMFGFNVLFVVIVMLIYGPTKLKGNSKEEKE